MAKNNDTKPSPRRPQKIRMRPPLGKPDPQRLLPLIIDQLKRKLPTTENDQ